MSLSSGRQSNKVFSSLNVGSISNFRKLILDEGGGGGRGGGGGGGGGGVKGGLDSSSTIDRRKSGLDSSLNLGSWVNGGNKLPKVKKRAPSLLKRLSFDSGPPTPTSSIGGLNQSIDLRENTPPRIKQNISVTIRFRPLNKRETLKGDEISWYPEDDKTVQSKCSPVSVYEFDTVFGPNTTTSEVYATAAKHVIQAAMDGVNGTVFAYGVTSSGKTHTMHGDQQCPGIIPLAIQDVFRIKQETPGREFLIRMSYLEIYNEVINDLLDPAGQNLRVREDVQGTFVEGMKEETVLSPAQAISLIQAGEEHRHVGSNNFNLASSRSHTIFTMRIENNPRSIDGEDGTISQLNLIDLAGSESSKTETTGLTRKEGTFINKSLLTLGTVIGKLSDGKASHIPYRDSKLTRLLQPSLSGRGHASLICTITPASSSFEETHNTLKFAHKAKHIETHASANKIVDDKSLIKKYQKEIVSLKTELEQLKQGLLVEKPLAASDETVHHLQVQIEKNEIEIKEESQPIQLMTHAAEEASLNSISRFEIPENVSKLINELNEKTFELEVKSADNRVLEEQLQKKVQIEKNEVEIKEGSQPIQLMTHAAEEASLNRVSTFKIPENVSKLINELNEKTFELEVKSADNRVLEEQLQKKIEENHELQEKVKSLELQLSLTNTAGPNLAINKYKSGIQKIQQEVKIISLLGNLENDVDWLSSDTLSRELDYVEQNKEFDFMAGFEKCSTKQSLVQSLKLAKESDHTNDIFDYANVSVDLINLEEEITTNNGFSADQVTVYEDLPKSVIYQQRQSLSSVADGGVSITELNPFVIEENKMDFYPMEQKGDKNTVRVEKLELISDDLKLDERIDPINLEEEISINNEFLTDQETVNEDLQKLVIYQQNQSLASVADGGVSLTELNPFVSGENKKNIYPSEQKGDKNTVISEKLQLISKELKFDERIDMVNLEEEEITTNNDFSIDQETVYEDLQKPVIYQESQSLASVSDGGVSITELNTSVSGENKRDFYPVEQKDDKNTVSVEKIQLISKDFKISERIDLINLEEDEITANNKLSTDQETGYEDLHKPVIYQQSQSLPSVADGGDSIIEFNPFVSGENKREFYPMEQKDDKNTVSVEKLQLISKDFKFDDRMANPGQNDDDNDADDDDAWMSSIHDSKVLKREDSSLKDGMTETHPPLEDKAAISYNYQFKKSFRRSFSSPQKEMNASRSDKSIEFVQQLKSPHIEESKEENLEPLVSYLKASSSLPYETILKIILLSLLPWPWFLLMLLIILAAPR